MCGAAFFKGLGLLALVAPAALLLRRRENLRPWLLRACAALAAFVLLFIPWWVRNGLLTGEFVPFTANRGDIQLMGSYIGFGYPEGTYEEAVLQSDREAWEQGYQDDMERRFARRGEMGKERLWQWFTENPLAFVASHLIYKPLALTVSHLRTVDLMSDRLMALVWWGCLALAAWGLLCPRLGGCARRGYYVPAVYLLVATLVTAIYAPLPRYGVSHVPIWLVYSGAGLKDLGGRALRLVCGKNKIR